MIRALKRYRNRKLYDTGAGKYLSFPGVADLVRAGDQVTVYDHRTRKDLTAYVLAAIVAKDCLKPSRPEVVDLLVQILRTPKPEGKVS